MKGTGSANPAQIDLLRTLLTEKVGYQLPKEFASFIHRQAVNLCSDLALSSLSELIGRLEKEDTHSALWVRFISRMTIGESYLFRNPNHMKLLQKQVLPALLEQAERRPVRLWSAGCARGEEPYTLAILLHELDPEVAGKDIRIIATDIDADALEAARDASYGAWAFRQTPYHIQRKYFAKHQSQLVLHPSVVSMVDFGYHHVAVDRDLSIFPRHGFDLILCRNLLMYLRTDFRTKAGRALMSRLFVGGLLLPGQVEKIEGADDELDRIFVNSSAVYFRANDRDEVDSLLDREPQRSRQRSTDKATTKRISLTGIPAVTRLKSSTVGGVGPARKVFPRVATPARTEAPENVPAPARPEPQQASDQPVASIDPTTSPPKYSERVAQIRQLMAEGDAEEALNECRKLIEDEPLESLHHSLLALALLEKEHTDAALSALRRAIYCDPDGLTAYYIWWLIGVRYRGVDWDRTQWARKHLARLIRNLPDDHRVPLVERVTAGDIRYLLQRNWDSFRK